VAQARILKLEKKAGKKTRIFSTDQNKREEKRLPLRRKDEWWLKNVERRTICLHFLK
jgi:hypothetical protein